MKSRAALLVALALLASHAGARDKFSVRKPLLEDDSTWLAGSTVLVVRHSPGWLRQQTVSGNIFPIAGAVNSSRIRDAASFDPADLVERDLAPLVLRQFGLKQVPPSPGAELVSTRAAEDVAKSDAVYLLDIRTTRREVNYRRKNLDDYWVGYGVRVSLLERQTARPLFESDCYTDTVDHPGSPSLKSPLEGTVESRVEVHGPHRRRVAAGSRGAASGASRAGRSTRALSGPLAGRDRVRITSPTSCRLQDARRATASGCRDISRPTSRRSSRRDPPTRRSTVFRP